MKSSSESPSRLAGNIFFISDDIFQANSAGAQKTQSKDPQNFLILTVSCWECKLTT
jgi:hypothetical protein